MEKLGNRSLYFGSSPFVGLQGVTEILGAYAVMFRDFLRMKVVVRNVALVVVVYVSADWLAWNAGRKSAERSLGPIAHTVSQLDERTQRAVANVHARLLKREMTNGGQ